MMKLEIDSGPYKRGQALLALWLAFTSPIFTLNAVVPPSFARRVVKFIELGVGWSGERPGTGTDLGFDLAAIFELGIALDLQDLGLNQLEVARFIKGYRSQLRIAFAQIDLTPGQGMSVFMVVRARSATEPVRLMETRPNGFFSKQTVWYEPEFFEGGESLGERLRTLGGRDRKRLVIEIRDLALLLAAYLPLTPLKKRGRQ